MKRLGICVAMLLALSAGVAQAKVWKIDYVASRLSFSGTQTGNPFTGSFGAYEAKVISIPRCPPWPKSKL